ncbi:FIST signal transduction protein [Novispirillum itersonii]|uniref:FIST signal transduction protein n=1 Tax=Novispirillum itersonii TaxID=189 RepID=UPI0003663C18|nr:FIST N-terminal domain-containing protein [Novispirillum itersonii]
MRCTQITLSGPLQPQTDLSALQALSPDLVLVFASVTHLTIPGALDPLRAAVPDAIITGCSTAGEISAEGVSDLGMVITAISFTSTTARLVSAPLPGLADSFRAGTALAEQLGTDAPAAILLFGRGTDINGTALIEGITGHFGAAVPVSGGLAGDDGAFRHTVVIGPSGVTDSDVVALGLYGDALTVQTGSYGGWQPFGPLRQITRAEGNILYTLDDEPALEIYRRYLGDHAEGLPASGLLFPFEMIRSDTTSEGLIRTILGIDPEAGSLILAGAVTPGHYLRMMHASTDALVLGAERAATQVLSDPAGSAEAPQDGLALLVSCVGRKLVMGDRVDEEIEVVTEALGGHHTVAGFYSYGEINPQRDTADGTACRLHNQTMTIALLTEARP